MRSVGQHWIWHESGVPCHWVSGQNPGTQNESTPMNIKNVAVALVTLIASSAAQAQDEPMQWRVEDGGNGHWYAGITTWRTWADARTHAAALGAYLATETSTAENTFVNSVRATFGLDRPWLGGFQDLGASDYSEPAGGWRWVTGEPWSFTAWGGDEPNNQGNEHWLHYGNNLGFWNDLPSWSQWPALIEWSADCNNDGIVDYGQIYLQPELFSDANGNGVLDACEACGLDWAALGDSIPIPTQADAWYGPGAQFLDANGDGIQDIVFASRPIQARLGLGGGRFGPAIISEPLGWFGGYCVADLNGDSFDDFVSYDYFAGRDRVMFSLGDGRFAQSQELVTGNWAAPCRVGDMDGDGDLDIVGGTELEGYLRIFRNDGTGNFDGGVTIGGVGTYHREMELADLDGDGDLDIVVQNEWIYQTIRILRNDGSMSFVHQAPLAYPGGALYLLPFDYDRDGDLDLLGSTVLGDLRVYRKDSNGLSYTVLTIASISNRALALALNDFDHDGLEDLFLADNDRFGFMRSRSTGGLESPVWISVPNKDRFVLVDLNGDSDMDVATSKQTPESLGTVDFLMQTCNGLPCPGDITNDGSIDAVDLAIILVAWGTHKQGEFNADLNNDGIVESADLSIVLGGWGPCPN